MSLPYGYDTLIGARGGKLSDGQRQRIGIARLIVRNPKVVILDEAASFLDNLTENELQRNLDDFWRDRTRIVIANRLRTIRDSDEIYFLKDGEIIANGTHEDLLSKCREYQEMWRLEARDRESTLI
jgi:ABC-type multidrug transport system fused ATPase/permease subunit